MLQKRARRRRACFQDSSPRGGGKDNGSNDPQHSYKFHIPQGSEIPPFPSLPSSLDRSILRALQPTLTSADRRRLKGQAQLLEPVLKVGHAGVTPAFLASVEQELVLRGLIKIKFTDRKEEKRALSEEIARATGCELLQIVGHVAVFYRPKPPKEA